ncbi:MAG: molybdenum cofactor biosynthesis protein MoaE [Candidatus Sumerlaeaceae bacterium]|jgi:molybdopterin synthase catalytic subunit
MAPLHITFHPAILCQLLAPGVVLNSEELVRFATAEPHGALVSFHGVVRPLENGAPISGLDYEWHDTLAERELHRIVAQTAARFPVTRVACAHRTGFVPAGETVVAIYVAADHRTPAFEACQAIIAELKAHVPIWKSPMA